MKRQCGLIGRRWISSFIKNFLFTKNCWTEGGRPPSNARRRIGRDIGVAAVAAKPSIWCWDPILLLVVVVVLVVTWTGSVPFFPSAMTKRSETFHSGSIFCDLSRGAIFNSLAFFVLELFRFLFWCKWCAGMRNLEWITVPLATLYLGAATKF